MLLRPILWRSYYEHKHFPKFCTEIAILPASTKNASSEKEYVISYLVNRCGLSSEMAISASKKVQFDSGCKPNAVLSFLGKLGFSKSQISELVSKKPKILLSNPHKTLLPKIEYVSQLTGMKERDTLKIVARYPIFLSKSAKTLESSVGPIFNYLKDAIGAEKATILLRRGSWVFNIDLENKAIPNVAFLRKLGVPQSFIQLALFNCPEIFSTNDVEFKEIVESVQEMGFDPLKSTFILAIHTLTGKGNAALWDQCYETYSKWGWSKDDIYTAFRKHPNCMLLSDKKISTGLDFVVNKIGKDSRIVAQCPYILFYNMKKRIIPRCSVVHLLSQKGLVRKDWSLGNVLWSGEKLFLDKYVIKYADKIPGLYDFYKRKASTGVA